MRQPFGRKGGKGRGRGRGRGRGNDSGNGKGGGFGYSLKTGKPYETLAIVTQAQSQRLNGSPSPKKKLKLDKETVAEIFNAGRKSKYKAKPDDSDDDDDDDDGGLKAMLIKYKKSLMIRVRSADTTSATRSAKKSKPLQSLIGGMDSGSSIGIDSCSAVNVTTRREDPIFLNFSRLYAGYGLVRGWGLS